MSTVDVPFVKGGAIASVQIPDSLQVVDSPPSKDYGCFRIMTAKDGDKRVVWNRNVLAEIRDAKKMFDDLVKQGLCPYRVGTDGAATSEVMDEFDPVSEEVIFLPIAMVRGG